MGYTICPDGHRDVVCLCGSTRFRQQFEEITRELTLAGKIVLSVGCFTHADGLVITEEQKAELDRTHLRKIDLAEAVYLIDPGGYVGEGTAREIAYTERQRKPIRRWSVEKEGCELAVAA